LGIIVFYLVKQNYTVVADFEFVLGTLKTVDKFDNLLCKQTPSLGAVDCSVDTIHSVKPG
jgi:nuclear pore complex protein Nup205